MEMNKTTAATAETSTTTTTTTKTHSPATTTAELRATFEYSGTSPKGIKIVHIPESIEYKKSSSTSGPTNEGGGERPDN